MKNVGDKSILKSIKNPVKNRYEIEILCPEITFIGHPTQPDFACAKIIMYPNSKVIELKSLKDYLVTFRDVYISYERFVNVLYDDLMNTYSPHELAVEIEFKPRGGISSTLRVDSKLQCKKIK